MTIREEEAAERRRARSDLNAVVKLLKRAGISQNEVARTAHYSSGYVTQLLSDAYPPVKLTPNAIARLTAAADVHSRIARARLSPGEAEQLDKTLRTLQQRYRTERREVYGLDGAFLDRPAANYIPSDVDYRLAKEVSEHSTYGGVQVGGAPGQGKSWALANLALFAKATHHVVWADFSRFEMPGNNRIGADRIVAQELRKFQRRAFVHCERLLGRRHSGADPLPRAVAAAVEKADTGEHAHARTVSAVFDRLLDDSRAGLLADRSSGYVDAPTGDLLYQEDDLADDLCLALALLTARAVLAHEDGPPSGDPIPAKLLLLVDGPDPHGDFSDLLQVLREVRPLTEFTPELNRVLVVVARSSPAGKSTTLSASFLRQWYRVPPFSDSDFRDLVAVLHDHGILRLATPANGSAEVSENDQEDRPTDLAGFLLEQAKDIGGLNRRLTAWYLDFCHNSQAALSAGEYAGPETGDARLAEVESPWAERLVLELESLSPGEREEAEIWMGRVGDPPETRGPIDPGSRVLRTFFERLGILVDVEVPLVQRWVCDRAVEILRGRRGGDTHAEGPSVESLEVREQPT